MATPFLSVAYHIKQVLCCEHCVVCSCFRTPPPAAHMGGCLAHGGTLIARILKEAHKRWKQRNTQLLQSGDLMDHEWTPSTHTHKLPPSSPRKRKRDIQWFTTRLIETRMQHKLHDYTHKLTQKLTQYTLQSDTDPGEDSGGASLIEEVGTLEEEAIVGRSSVAFYSRALSYD